MHLEQHWQKKEMELYKGQAVQSGIYIQPPEEKRLHLK